DGLRYLESDSDSGDSKRFAFDPVAALVASLSAALSRQPGQISGVPSRQVRLTFAGCEALLPIPRANVCSGNSLGVSRHGTLPSLPPASRKAPRRYSRISGNPQFWRRE